MADKVLTDVRIQLRDGLTVQVIKQLLDDLSKEKVLNEEEAESILEENPSRADKARKLIDSVRKKGSAASTIMLTRLKECDEHLYKRLELDRLQPTCEKPAPGAPSGPFTISDPNDDKEYTMSSNPRGFCVIVNNIQFKMENHNREGAEYDSEALERVFNFLGFKVKTRYNLSAKEMKMLMQDYSKEAEHGDCFVCCVLSHGDKDDVTGTDMKPCSMKDILSPFDGKNCPSLAGKPKVFFIQACRGKNREEKVKVFTDDAAEADDTPPEPYTIPKHSDFLVAMSTVENFVSYRGSSGSWFIQSLCSHLEEGSQRGEDILAILTKVNDEVSRKEGKEEVNKTTCDAKMTPEPRFTLRKKLIFRIPNA